MAEESDRDHQRFPTLSDVQMDTARRFASGPEQSFAPGETVFAIGARDAPVWMVVAGSVEVTRRDGLSREMKLTSHGIGHFTGEINQLSGHAAIAGGVAGPAGCTAVPFDAAHLRSLMIGTAELGEIIMRALILRRVALIGQGGAGSVVIGTPGSPDVVRLQTFMMRSGLPNMLLDARNDAEGRALLGQIGVTEEELPLVVCQNGQVLRAPSNEQLAACLGIVPELDPQRLYDVAIVGAGPAGLAAAVYAASEGLSVIVLDETAMGGQAGASARIENYLGFPTGISGHALSARAFNQAMKFGAEMAIPVKVEHLAQGADSLVLSLSEDRRIKARSVVIASGARYRRPDVDNLASFEGAGVCYWVSAIEARLCAGEEVALVGGGNSAGQAVVYLAPQVRKLHLIVRRPLAETMSRYLIDRIDALENVELHIGEELQALEGTRATGLTAASFRNRATGVAERRALRHLFLFIGADPNTQWAQRCVATDAHGFVLTGQSDLPLQTDMSGVFAIGDARAGSTKRVAAAVGEGAAVVSQIHALFASQAKEAS
jgi:thioredoxin reductase (NADPH)